MKFDVSNMLIFAVWIIIRLFFLSLCPKKYYICKII